MPEFSFLRFIQRASACFFGLVGLWTMTLSGFSSATGPQATPISQATPTAATPMQIQKMTDRTLQKEAPAALIPSIDLPDPPIQYPGCMDHPDTPTLDYMTDALQTSDVVFIATCGWQPNEMVQVTLMDPFGKITSKRVQAQPSRHLPDVYEADLTYRPALDAPEGKYRFTFQGSGTVKAKVTYSLPKAAKFYPLTNDPFQPTLQPVGGQQRLQLQNFYPNDPVRIFAYSAKESQIKMIGWQDFTTDASGRLTIETDLSQVDHDMPLNFFVYGRETHFVALQRFSTDGVEINRQFDLDLYCPGAQSPRIQPFSNIHPAAGIKSLDIHQQPGFGSRILAQASGNTAMQVYGYPKCVDHAFWWKVSLRDPIVFGWAAESFLGKYQIELLPPTPAP